MDHRGPYGFHWVVPGKLAGLTSQVCCEDELIIICAPDYPLAGMKSVTPKALSDYEFISREPGSGTREITDAYFRSHKIPPESLKTQMELGSPEALKRSLYLVFQQDRFQSRLTATFIEFTRTKLKEMAS